MKKSFIVCLFLAVAVCGTGCGSQDSNDRIKYSQEDSSADDTFTEETEDEPSGTAQARTRVENNDNINHGHSITDRTEPDPRELLRSDEVLYDEEESKAFLLDNILYPEREPYTFEMTDSSIKDPGAYLWYDFTVFYNGIPVEGSEFKVITFNDGTIIEGDEGFFRLVPEDLSNIKTPEEILEEYVKQSSDNRTYQYQDAHYLYQRGSGECPYVYVYRYDCGKVLENTTLTLNAKTGELLGYYTDAID